MRSQGNGGVWVVPSTSEQRSRRLNQNRLSAGEQREWDEDEAAENIRDVWTCEAEWERKQSKQHTTVWFWPTFSLEALLLFRHLAQKRLLSFHLTIPAGINQRGGGFYCYQESRITTHSWPNFSQQEAAAVKSSGPAAADYCRRTGSEPSYHNISLPARSRLFQWASGLVRRLCSLQTSHESVCLVWTNVCLLRDWYICLTAVIVLYWKLLRAALISCWFWWPGRLKVMTVTQSKLCFYVVPPVCPQAVSTAVMSLSTFTQELFWTILRYFFTSFEYFHFFAIYTSTVLLFVGRYCTFHNIYLITLVVHYISDYTLHPSERSTFYKSVNFIGTWIKKKH